MDKTQSNNSGYYICSFTFPKLWREVFIHRNGELFFFFIISFVFCVHLFWFPNIAVMILINGNFSPHLDRFSHQMNRAIS